MAEETKHEVRNIYLSRCSISTVSGDVVSSPEEVFPSPPSSIDNIGRVTAGFVESRSYLQAKHRSEQETVAVMHLQGMPGSGKSEIVRKLGGDFPYEQESQVVIKWHIECSDCDHDIKVQLKILVESMVKNNLLAVDKGIVETALQTMMNSRCQQLVNILASCNFPILIIIEDPRKSDREMLNDFISCVLSVQDRTTNLHVYVTSRSKNTCDIPESARFYKQEVDGLVLEESFAFLGVPDNSTHDEKDAAKQIIERLSGSPLGLLAVKATQPASYKQYLEQIKNESLHQLIFENESAQIKEAKPRQKHLYESILYLVKPPNANDKNSVRRWKALCCLSFLHHGNIPEILVGRVMHYMRDEDLEIDKSAYLNKAHTNDFIRHFTDYNICKVTEDQKSLSFHQEVFTAVRLGQNDEYQSSLRVVIVALASLVHKDLRIQENIFSMYGFYPHMRCVLERQARATNDRFQKFCLSHISEVAGVVRSYKPVTENQVSEAELHLVDALESWLSVVPGLGARDLLEPSHENKVEDKTKLIVDRLTEVGKEIFSGEDFDIEKYISIVFHPKSTDMQHYLAQSNQNVADYLQIAMENQTPLQVKKLRLLRRERIPLFLEENLLCETYLVERIASVLHTMSRLLNLQGRRADAASKKRCRWYCTLCLAICGEVRERYGVAPLFLRITATSSIRLTYLKGLPDNERRAALIETKRLIEDKLLSKESRETLLYEHGTSIQVTRDDFDLLKHTCLIARINARLVCFGPKDDFDLQRADEVCEQLRERAKANIHWNSSTIWLVCCGKYWASRKLFDKAVEILEEALEIEKNRSQVEAVKVLSWVCYNHARAVLAGNIVNHAAASKAKCLEVLENRNQIERDLGEKLEVCTRRLEEMIEQQEANLSN